MSTISTGDTVGGLVAERPARSRIFEEYGIDYCCGGKKPLTEACAAKGVSADEVMAKLNELDTADTGDATDYASMPLDQLVDHIESTHHVYLRRELPRLQEMADKVARVHGEKNERLIPLAEVVQGLVAELSQHMMKEEQMLFPIVRELAHSLVVPEMHCGNLSNPIGVMEAEHQNAGNALESIRQLSDDHTPPDWACNTYRALLDGLRELELDLHQHIHKENNILFPRALELEASLP